MTEKYRIANPDPPSDMFIDSIENGGGSHEVNCGFCGRDHYAYDSDYIDEDNQKDRHAFLDEEVKKNPEGVILHYDCDYVSYKELNGITFVALCPCNGLRMYENFIWADRNSIRRFLSTKVSHELDLAVQEATKNKLADIPVKPPKSSEEIWRGW